MSEKEEIDKIWNERIDNMRTFINQIPKVTKPKNLGDSYEEKNS